MPLPTQTIDIPFTGGVSTKLDQALIDKSRLLGLQNGSVNKEGIIQRRDAWLPLNGATAVDPIELAVLGTELLAIDTDDNNLYSYSPTDGVLTSVGQPAYFALSKKQISRSAGNVASMDSAYTSGYTCFAWLQLGNGNAVTSAAFSILDEASQSLIVDGQVLTLSSTAGAPRICVMITGEFTIFWGDGTTINATVVTTTGNVLAGPTAIAADYRGTSSAAPLDVLVVDGAGHALVTYASTKASTSVGALVVNSALSISHVEITVASNSFSGITSIGTVIVGGSIVNVIFKPTGAASQTVILGWNAGTLALIVAHAAASTGFTAGGAGGAVTIVSDGANVHVFDFTYQTGAGATPCMHAILSSSNVISGATTLVKSIQFTGGLSGPNLAGKAFFLNGEVYVPIAMTSDLQPGLFVMDTTGQIQAQALYGSLAASTESATVGILATWGGVLPSAPINGLEVSIPVPEQGQLSFSEGINVTPSGVTRILLTQGRNNSPGLWHAQANGSIYFSGSYMTMYDGSEVTEAGFFYFPENVTAVAHSGTGITGVFQVRALYEYIDAQGRRHQSAPSAPVTVSLSNKGGIDYAAASLLLGIRCEGCSVVFFRTTNDGETFYRINPVNNPIQNNAGVASVSGTDTTPTSDPTVDPITANEELYTTGGYLPNDNPPACNAITAHQGRIIYSNAEDGQDWRFSQAPVLGQGLYFNESLLGGRTPQSTGTITALSPLDDKLVIFTATNKLWTSGQGPASNGLNGGYALPQLLPSDVGCVDQRTIALLPDLSAQDGPVQLGNQGGLGHQTKHGYYLLTRALTDFYVGMPDGIDLEGTTVTSAVVLHDKHQLRLTIPSNSTMAVFDYLMGQWLTFASTASIVPQSACISNGLWTSGNMAALGGGLFQDAIGQYQDAGSTVIQITMFSVWIKLAALQGFERIRRALFFGPYGSPSTITITENVNYDSSGGPWGSANEATSGLTTGDGLRWQFRWHIPQQKCESIQFVITDTPDGTGDSSGAGFSGMTLELGVKKGTAKLSPARST